MSGADRAERAARLASALVAWRPDAQLRVEWLAGDGSNRAYARVHSGAARWIAMVLADPEPHRQAEEVGADADVERLPFLEMRELLAAHGLPVPALIHADEPAGVLLLEDLGDRHLSDMVAAGDAAAVEAAYAQALGDLVRFQAIAPEPRALLFRRRYDAGLWQWELAHFREYGVEARGGVVLPPAVRAELDARFAATAARIAAQPAVAVHRDYHSRNLILDGSGRLRWIDFQDALLGPALYDVASLLYDAYVDLGEPLRARLFAAYLDAARAAGVPLPADPATALRVLAIHRMLKAAGRFVFFRDVKGRPGYMAHVPDLLHRVDTLLNELQGAEPDLAQAVTLMRPYVPEWAGG